MIYIQYMHLREEERFHLNNAILLYLKMFCIKYRYKSIILDFLYYYINSNYNYIYIYIYIYISVTI